MSFKYWESALDSRLHSLDKSLHQDGIEPEPRLVRMQLELEARAMRSSLSQLHQKLNELSTASSLPSATLQRIFLILSIHEPVPNVTWPTRARESCHWTKVLNVCRTWRNAALACPHLWASPPLGLGSARFNAFMARSQDVPIYLDPAPNAGDLSAALLYETLQEPEDLVRIRSLDLGVPLGQDALQALTGSVPLLESLRIVPIETLEEPQVMALPEGLLSGQAPRLRVLSLRGFSTFFAQSAITSKLISLEISRGVEESSYTRPSWGTIRCLLGSLVSIEKLTLHGCLPKAPKPSEELPPDDDVRAPSANPAQVDLLRLQKFDISGELEPIVWLFKSITLHPTCRLRVQLRDSRSDVHGMTESLSTSGFLPLHEEATSHYQSMRVLTCKGERDRKILHIGLFPGVEASLAEPCPFTIEVDLYAKVQPLATLEFFCLPLRGLRTLYLGGDIAESSQRIILPMRVPSQETSHKTFAFQDCAQITSIYTEGATAKSLIKALDFSQLFPALQRLIIVRGLDFEEDYKQELMITWKVLHRTLTARKEARSPIDSILLSPDILKEYWVERMQDTGGHFKPLADVEANTNAEETCSSLIQLLTIADDPIPREY